MALLAFTSLLLVNRVFILTRYFVEKGVNPWYMVEMLFYFSPAVFVLTVPMSFLVGIVTAFGRLSFDNEITAIKTAGVSTYRLIIPVVLVSFALSIFMVLFMNFTIPNGNKAYAKLDKEIRRKNPALVLEPDVVMDEMSSKEKKWYFKSIDPETGRMKNIRIWEYDSGTAKTPKLITAEEGELNSFSQWTSLKLYRGTIYQADRKDPTKGFVIGTFAEDEVILDISGSLDKEYQVSSRARNMSIKEIKAKIKEFRAELKLPTAGEENSGAMAVVGPARKRRLREYLIPMYCVEYWKKYSIPFACLAFGLIAVPVGLIVRRGGRMAGLGVGLGIITLYYVFLTAGEKIARTGAIPPFLGAWIPNILTCVLGTILIMRSIREAPIRSSDIINKLFPPKDTYETDPEVGRSTTHD